MACQAHHHKKKEFGVSGAISESTIRSRVYQGKSLDPKHLGTVSPMAEAESMIVEICSQMGKIPQPLNVTEAIYMANDLIKHTDFQDAVAEFQKVRHLGSAECVHGTLSKHWWKGFLRQNHHRLVTKRRKMFACNRAQWTTVQNIKQMYDMIYNEFGDAGIATYREKHVFTDK